MRTGSSRKRASGETENSQRLDRGYPGVLEVYLSQNEAAKRAFLYCQSQTAVAVSQYAWKAQLLPFQRSQWPVAFEKGTSKTIMPCFPAADCKVTRLGAPNCWAKYSFMMTTRMIIGFPCLSLKSEDRRIRCPAVVSAWLTRTQHKLVSPPRLPPNSCFTLFASALQIGSHHIAPKDGRGI